VTTEAQGGVEATEPRGEKASSAPGASGPPLSTQVLGALRPVALLTIVGAVLARGLVPALHGFAVGYDRFTNRAQSFAEVLSQLVAVILLATAVMLLVEVVRSRAPLYLRAMSILPAGAVCLLVFGSIESERAFAPVLGVLSVSSSLLAIASGVDAVKQPAAGSLGVVVALAGVSSTLRGLSVLLASRAAHGPVSEGVDGARAVATGAFAIQIMLLVIAVGWITTRAKKVTSPAVVVALALAALATQQALSERGDPGALHFVVRNTVLRLMSRPEPYVPVSVALFVATFTPLLALAVLAHRNQVPALLASLALAVLVGPTAEIPLHSIALVVASLAVTLASRDARGVWAAIASAERSRKAS
jgi:hypothetical protein